MVKWATASDEKSIVYYHHHDGDLHHADWRTADVCANRHFAPVLLVTLRIIQGLGAGAEISGAGTMLAEYAPKGKRGIISSLVAMGTNCGTLSATAIWAVMFFALEREQLIARDGVFLSGERRCYDIRDLAANESERKSGIRKSKRR